MPTSLGGTVFQIDYTSRDYESLRGQLITLAGDLADDWTDFHPGDIGVTLLEAMAYTGDVLGYYIDRVGNEAYLPTCTQRRSALLLGALVGYAFSPATSAVVEMTFTCNAAGTIPAGAQVSTDPAAGEAAVVFEVRDELVVVGAGDVTVECIHGTSVVESVGSGNAQPYQQLGLSQSPLAADPDGSSSLVLEVDEGSGYVQWEQVDNFTESEPADRHFTVEVDENDSVTLTFGNGVNGRTVPAGTDNVRAEYRVGGGKVGNAVGSGKIVKLLTTLAFVDSVVNDTNPQGGSDKESLDEAREGIPASVQALDRAVTHRDYETLAKKVGGVAQAKATQGIGPFEEIVYIAATGVDPIPTGTWDPRTDTGTGFLGQVGAYLAERKSAPRLIVRPPTAIPLELVIELVVRPKHYQADVQAAVEDAIIEFVQSAKMGESIVLGDLTSVIDGVDGVDKVVVVLFRKQAVPTLIRPDPFFYTGLPDTTWSIVTTDDTDHAAFVMANGPGATLQEVLTVTFLSASVFRVTGSVTGVQSTLGQVGAAWHHDLNNLTITATAGTVPNYAGNTYRISVGSGALVGQVSVDEYEIATLVLADITLSALSGGIA